MKKTNIDYLFLVAIFFLNACDKTQSETQTEKTPSKITITQNSNVTNLIPPLFDETSITREYLNKYQGLKWKNTLGDWIDLDGVPQGKTAWATVDVSRNTKEPITLDVTNLIKKQQGEKNQLLVLRSTVPVKIFSREGKHTPILKIIFNDNTKPIALKPSLDCTIAKSTVKNINSDILGTDGNSSVSFIQFKLPNQKIKTATLVLWPKKIFGNGKIQVFDLDFNDSSSQMIPGIANTKTSFSELRTHPDVIFVDTFDDNKLKPEWFQQVKLDRSHSQIENGYLSGGSYPEDNHSLFNIRYFFKKNLGFEPTEMYLRYSIRFHDDFIYATQGGKAPGLSGTYNTCGWGGRKPSKTCNGWSARMSFGLPIKTGLYKDMIPIGTYLYHIDQQGYYGDGEKWQAFCSFGKWCELEQYVKLNTPGKNDGILRGFHNGKLVYERKDIRFRLLENIKIEDAWILLYHGGMGFPTKPIHADIDNIVISKSYVGMLKNQDSPHHSDNTNSRVHAPINSAASNIPLKTGYLTRNTKHSIPVKDTLKKFKKNLQLLSIPKNTIIDLGSFSCTNPEGDGQSCKKVTDYSGMVYDQNHHQILMFGGGHSTTFTDSVFIFNFNSLTWKEDYPPTPCTLEYMNKDNYHINTAWKTGPQGPYPRPISRHTYDLLAVATGLPDLIMMMWPNGHSHSCPPNAKWTSTFKAKPMVAHYNLKNKKWLFSKTAEPDGRPYKPHEYTAAEYDPVSGMIILLGRYGLYLYNPIDRTKTRLIDYRSYDGNYEKMGIANELVYYPPNDKMYYFSRKSKSVWEINLNRENLALSTVKELMTKGDYPEHAEPGYAYDSINEVIAGAVFNNKFYIFDPKTKTWSHQIVSGGKPGTMEFHCIAFDPVDNVFIFLTKGFRTWAYRYK